MNKYASIYDFDLECRNSLSEWRGSGAIFRAILITMPWAGYAAVNDPAFAKWTVLMLANVRYRGHLSVITEDCHALS
jgi:hypothetical protein